jgi:hypothetical protein
MKRVAALLLMLAGGALASAAPDAALPNRPTSLKFAAIGNSGHRRHGGVAAPIAAVAALLLGLTQREG